MVDRPRLTPTVGARGTASDVPTVGRELRTNFNGIPSVRPSGLEAAARAFNVNSQVFGQIQQQFEISAEEGLREIRSEQQVEAEKMYSEGRLQIEGAVSGIKSDPNLPTGEIAEATLSAFDSVAESTLKNAKSPFQKNYLEQKFAGSRESVGTSAIRAQAQKEMAEREVDFARKLEVNQSLIASSPDTYEEVLNEQIQALNEVPMDDETRAAVEAETRESFAISRVKGLMRDNPDEAATVLIDETFTAQLPEQTITALMQDVKNRKTQETIQAEKEKSLKQAQTVTQAKELAVSGNLTNTEVLDMAEAGEIEPQQAAELVADIEEQAAEAQIEAIETQEVLGAMQGLNILSGDSTTKVNNTYTKEIAPLLENMSPEEAQQVKLRFISSTNKIPSVLGAELKGTLRGGTPEQKVRSARLVSAIQEASPIAFVNDIAAKDVAIADRMNALLDAGIPEDQVVETIEKQDSLTNQGTAEIRRKSFEDEFKKVDAVQKAQDEFDTLFGLEPEVSDITSSRERLNKDMQALAEKYYLDNPDMEKAIEYASKNIGRTWGVTKRSGGGKRLMKYAPENYYPTEEGSKWINKQLINDVKTIAPEATEENVFLVPDAQTAREASKGSPGYTVLMKNSDGTLKVLDQRWSPDPTDQIAKINAKRSERAAKNIERVRKKKDRVAKLIERQEIIRRNKARDAELRKQDLEKLKNLFR